MIDLHCHYLPGIDDGAQDLDEALALARAAVDNGIHTAVLTPHVHPGRYDNGLASLRPHFNAFRDELRRAGIPLQVHLGGEVRLLPEAIMMLAAGDLPMLGTWDGHLVVLLEFPHDQVPVGAINAVRYLRTRGIVPMIAHPERNKDILRDWRRLEPFVLDGCLLQVTAASVCGLFGVPAQQTADQLIAMNWVSVIATDAHNLEHRPPMLAQARFLVEQRYGPQVAFALTEGNPAKIVAGNDFE